MRQAENQLSLKQLVDTGWQPGTQTQNLEPRGTLLVIPKTSLKLETPVLDSDCWGCPRLSHRDGHGTQGHGLVEGLWLSWLKAFGGRGLEFRTTVLGI